VVFLPYLFGERTPVWDPDARGAWVGVSATTGRHHLIRAVLESAGYGMRQLLEIEEGCYDRKISEILVVGGGARSRAWTGVNADITGRRYLRTDDVEASSRGAAMLAAVGARVYEDAWAAQAALGAPEAELLEPTTDLAVREVYDSRYRVFLGLYPALRELFGGGRDGSPGNTAATDFEQVEKQATVGNTATTTGDAVGGLGGRIEGGTQCKRRSEK
jgi:xylulokinase